MHIVSILGSNREERNGNKVFSWFKQQATKKEDLSWSFLDIAEYPLPFIGQTKELSDTDKTTKENLKKGLLSADAFIFVVPEYNHSFPGVFKNLLDHFYEEWKRKPVAFITYSSGMSGGIRATEQLRQIAGELHMADLRDAVHIPFIDTAFDESGNLENNDFKSKNLETVLTELAWWANKLKD